VAFLFERKAGMWAFRYDIVAPDGLAGDHFGHSLALSLYRAAIGAPLRSTSPELGAVAEGRVYPFLALGHVVMLDGFED
jgi:FG-GAP repeat